MYYTMYSNVLEQPLACLANLIQPHVFKERAFSPLACSDFTTCDLAQLRHVYVFSVLSCFLCNEVCIAPLSMHQCHLHNPRFGPRGIYRTLSGITNWTVCCMVCCLSEIWRKSRRIFILLLIWSERHCLRIGWMYLSVHKCVMDRNNF